MHLFRALRIHKERRALYCGKVLFLHGTMPFITVLSSVQVLSIEITDPDLVVTYRTVPN
jgi:hypothetical protein